MARLSASSSADSTNGYPPTSQQPASSGTTTATDTAPLPNQRVTRLASTQFDNAFDYESMQSPHTSLPLPGDSSLEPFGKRSLSLIAVQAFGLGFVLATSLIMWPYLAFVDHDLWRVFAFLACLSVFHFFEFWTTATFNTGVVRASSFLLFSNGWQYNVAHSLATFEIAVSALLFPNYQHRWTSKWTMGAGLLFVFLGQWARSVAMCTAATNFNHLPARTRRAGHVLVTWGIYGKIRHPAYFGFYWWAIGTQLLVGNKLCTVGYAIVLWLFFKKRIRAEESRLVEFFPEEYAQYRSKTPTGIPFVR